ncbi:MAG: short-chain dehydrogenase [Candidatus Marinimicrobia bacterium]|nr:short-chain dehydrogenase [Candidatus Neomarinimicrobiota bacterium]
MNDKTINEIDYYLSMPKAFVLEMPLYLKFDLSDRRIAGKIFWNLMHEETIDAYCVKCKKDGIFRPSEENVDNVHYSNLDDFANHKSGLIEIIYECARESSHIYHTYFIIEGKIIQKIGQFPSIADFQIPQVEKYRKVLGKEQLKEFTVAIGLKAHGVGIGSFVYIRRIFENLIDQAHNLAKSEIKDFSEDIYLNSRMDKKIIMLKDFLPVFLVENRILYAILSKGIHELSEEECLLYFDTVKIVIEQILDEKYIQNERASKIKESEKAINILHSKLKTS